MVSPSPQRSLLVLFLLCWICLAVASPSSAFPLAQRESEQTEDSVSRGHLLIACGLPGDEEHRDRYVEVIDRLTSALTSNWGFDEELTQVLFGSDEMVDDGHPVPTALYRPCTRESLLTAVRHLRRNLKPEDRVWIVFIGHGFFDGERATFNIAGPDPTSEDLGAMLSGIACRECVVWMTTSYSGCFLQDLAASDRIVVTATHPDREINSTYFPDAFAQAVAHPTDPSQLDGDHDGQLSLLDLYLDICRRVGEQYEISETGITEHARLDDHGDGVGAEVQLPYLLPKHDGRLRPGESPPVIKDGMPGAIAAGIPLSLKPQGSSSSDAEP